MGESTLVDKDGVCVSCWGAKWERIEKRRWPIMLFFSEALHQTLITVGCGWTWIECDEANRPVCFPIRIDHWAIKREKDQNIQNFNRQNTSRANDSMTESHWQRLINGRQPHDIICIKQSSFNDHQSTSNSENSSCDISFSKLNKISISLEFTSFDWFAVRIANTILAVPPKNY